MKKQVLMMAVFLGLAASPVLAHGGGPHLKGTVSAIAPDRITVKEQAITNGWPRSHPKPATSARRLSATARTSTKETASWSTRARRATDSKQSKSATAPRERGTLRCAREIAP